MLKFLGSFVFKYFPRTYYHVAYHRVTRKLEDKARDRAEDFDKLVAESGGRDCLQIGVRDKKLAPHWISVDLYDRSDYIDYNYDIHDLKFDDETFDVVVCNAILEHVEDPVRALSELHRVLREDGLIWVEVPFNQPYHPAPNDYWRVSPEGLRIWMKDFAELSSGLFSINKSSIYNGVYYYGQKRGPRNPDSPRLP